MSDTHHQPTDEAQEGVSSAATTVASYTIVTFADVLRYLRGLSGPCVPPIGAGAFDVLYASAREVVVWYAPAREGQAPREVAIPCAPLDAAWGALRDAQAVAEASLCELAGGAAGGRWLLVVLAQLPMTQVRADADGAYTLAWSATSSTDAATGALSQSAGALAMPDAPAEPSAPLAPAHAEADAV